MPAGSGPGWATFPGRAPPTTGGLQARGEPVWEGTGAASQGWSPSQTLSPTAGGGVIETLSRPRGEVADSNPNPLPRGSGGNSLPT